MSQTPEIEHSTETQSAAVNPVEALKAEFQTQFEALKAEFNDQLNQLKSENESLRTQNNDLNRALVRSSLAPAPKEPEPKTEEQLYRERIDELAKRTLDRMCKS